MKRSTLATKRFHTERLCFFDNVLQQKDSRTCPCISFALHWRNWNIPTYYHCTALAELKYSDLLFVFTQDFATDCRMKPSLEQGPQINVSLEHGIINLPITIFNSVRESQCQRHTPTLLFKSVLVRRAFRVWFPPRHQTRKGPENEVGPPSPHPRVLTTQKWHRFTFATKHTCDLRRRHGCLFCFCFFVWNATD